MQNAKTISEPEKLGKPTKCAKSTEAARSEVSAQPSFALGHISEASPSRAERETECGESERGSASPSLSESHISDSEEKISQPDLPFRLTGSQKKTAFALRHNAEKMCGEVGIERVGMLTLTVGDWKNGRFVQVFSAEEANARINNLNRRVIEQVFGKAIIVTERHKSGAIHFHLLGTVSADIRTGFDFEALKRAKDARKRGWIDHAAERAYKRSASPALRALWALLLRKLRCYGFGRAELTPIRKCAAAVSSYVAKYIEKNLFNRLAEDRRKKLVRYIGWNKRQLKPNEFSWNTEGAAQWRRNARKLAHLVTLEEPQQMRVLFGPRWAYAVSQIMPSLDSDMAGRHEWCTELMLRESERLTRSRDYLESRMHTRTFELLHTRKNFEAEEDRRQKQLFNNDQNPRTYRAHEVWLDVS